MIQTKLSTKAIALFGTALTLIFIGVESSLAQTGEPIYQNNERDTFSGDSTGDLNPLDLINRVRVAPSRSIEQFNEDSQENIQDAAAEFKRQREQLLNSYSESSTEKETE